MRAKSRNEAQNVAERIDNRIAEIIERNRRFTIALNYRVGIFSYFPRAFDGNRDQKPPGERHFPENQRRYPEKHNTVQNVRECVWVENVLRIVRAP